MKQIVSILFYLIAIITSSIAQNSPITFEKKSHDFGTFPEDGDSPTCNFQFINQGKEAIAIVHVQTTCGCAVASYTHTPIAPGQTGNISITYNPQGRPGKFARSALVSFSNSNEKVKLYITGMVTPGVERKHKSFPYVMGDLQLKTTGIRFNPMRGKEQEQNIVVVNSGKTPIRLQIHSSDSSLSGRMEPEVLAPESIGEIRITRKANSASTQTKCIKLKEDSTIPPQNGYIYINIVTEKCR